MTTPHEKISLTRRDQSFVYIDPVSGATLAEVTFPADASGVWVLDHTWVDPSLRGGGVASQLVSAVVEAARVENARVRAVCPYAVLWFERHPEAVADIRAAS